MNKEQTRMLHDQISEEIEKCVPIKQAPQSGHMQEERLNISAD